MRNSRNSDDRYSSLMWGIGLMLVGTTVLLQYLDVLPGVLWRQWWPFIIVMVGLSQFLCFGNAKRMGDGVSTMMIGGWCFIATNHVLGLTWSNSWPLALVAAGTGMVVRAILGYFMRDDRDGVREVRSDG